MENSSEKVTNNRIKESPYYLEPGTVIGNRYAIERVIGSGGFGITYEGHDRVLDRKAAIKEYFPNGMVSRSFDRRTLVVTGDVTEEDYRGDVSRFLNEAKIIAGYNKVPNVVHIYDFIEENNTAYIVMEYIEGRTLDKYLEEHSDGRLPVEEAVRITSDLLKTLEIIHKDGILHRDISPGNIIIEDDGTVRLIDFGAARYYASEKTQKLSVIVKRGYTSPEQYRRDVHQDERSDIYSLGCTLFRMVTGKDPDDVINRIQQDKVNQYLSDNKDIPKWLSAVLKRAMAVLPANRFSDDNAFLQELEGGPQRYTKKRRRIICLIAAVLCFAGIIAFATQISNTGDRGQTVPSEAREKTEATEETSGEELTTEESDALLEAINSASYGDTIYVEPGNYYFKQPITVKSDNVSIVGKGKTKPVLNCGFYITSSNITLENLDLEVDSPSNVEEGTDCIKIEGDGITTIKDVDVNITYGSENIIYGILVYSDADITNTRVDVSNAGVNGNVAIASNSELTLKNNVFKSNDVAVSIFGRDLSDKEAKAWLNDNDITAPTRIDAPRTY